MKRKLLFSLAVATLLVCLFAITVNADAIKRFETDEFQSDDNITVLENVNTDSYLTDAGRNTDITTYLDNEKYYSRAVLQNSDGTYTTYPAWYVFDFTYDWKGSYQKSTVERLNALSDVTDETYTIQNIIRIEYLEFNDAGLKIARTNAATPESFPNAKYVRLPSHFTGASFFNGKEVEVIEFAPGMNITSIGKAGFLNCYKLKELILPNTVTSIAAQGINFYNSQSTSALKLLNLGANITTLGGTNAIGNCRIPGIRVVVSDTLDGSVYNYEYFPNNAVVLFTGNKEQAEAFGFTNVYSYDEYIALGSPDGAKDNTIIVYGYSKCEAFYGGAHENLESINGCQAMCSRCNQRVKLESAVHENENVITYSTDSFDYYATTTTVTVACKHCGTVEKTVTINPIFGETMGYSVDLNNVGIVQSFYVDTQAVALYREYVNAEFDYGVVAATGTDAPLSAGNGSVIGINSRVIFKSFLNSEFKYFDIKVIGIPSEHASTAVICCAYIFDGESVAYASEGVVTQTAAGVTYSSFADADIG